MKRELEHYRIGKSYGGNQEWFRTFMMKLGGCGAETACESSLYFALHMGKDNLYPFDKDYLTRKSYADFGHIMEKYLWPRMSGIDRLDIFVDGYSRYLADRGETGITMDTLDGTASYEQAAAVIRQQIDAGLPVPTLILNHADRSLRDYNWHWFLINGYDETDDSIKVKAVTYSSYEWVDLRRLWNTGYERRGGLVLFRRV